MRADAAGPICFSGPSEVSVVSFIVPSFPLISPRKGGGGRAAGGCRTSAATHGKSDTCKKTSSLSVLIGSPDSSSTPGVSCGGSAGGRTYSITSCCTPKLVKGAILKAVF